MESSPAVAAGQMFTSVTVDAKQRSTHSTLTWPHSGFNRWRQWQVTCLQLLKTQYDKRQIFVKDVYISAAPHTRKVFGWMPGGSGARQRQTLEGKQTHVQAWVNLLDAYRRCAPQPYLAVWPWAWPPGRPGSHWLSCRLLWGWGLCKLGQLRPGLPWWPLEDSVVKVNKLGSTHKLLMIPFLPSPGFLRVGSSCLSWLVYFYQQLHLTYPWPGCHTQENDSSSSTAHVFLGTSNGQLTTGFLLTNP